ncbi:linear amide C-N hydrolase [Methylocystis sp. MJC1]|jgi:choloylglycine hydrolase|uniref:linear amide C-N hydrolase n=1 Tax=Methylocystis sp. MJC1 TaxID=2654282 RepID=UPI0013EBAC53|nr:linear amide C-N hydrolase [Methylocystis sp. MJC1]KAF2990532.1 Penicillin acylase [Methylocystis sp. MJC1]MBU6525807.1 linear amide C-N hydrolase [Methylocystis sp. MJC1]UZX12274.1 linear amide C-N hydrolase [Methylocystis sp. MJC1]
MKKALFSLCLVSAFAFSGLSANACTRILYETGAKSYQIGRTMDWMVDPGTDLWAFPKGMARDGGVGQGSIKWTAKHGSVISSFYNLAAVDGMNDAGLVANVLYLVEADYGDAAKSKKPKLSIGAWAQYALDNFGSVAEAVAALQKEPFVLIAPDLPDGNKAGAHLALADASGDSAIFEYLNGKLVIHHGAQYRVMTNSPSFDQQLAIESYWKHVDGEKFLPGTARSADRFARVSWNLNAAAKEKDPRLATATTFSLIRAISVPLGIADPERPNIASTIWRTVSDLGAKRYYFESAYSPSIFWVDLDRLKLEPGAKPMKLDLSGKPILSGEVSGKFVEAEAFKFLAR